MNSTLRTETLSLVSIDEIHDVAMNYGINPPDVIELCSLVIGAVLSRRFRYTVNAFYQVDIKKFDIVGYQEKPDGDIQTRDIPLDCLTPKLQKELRRELRQLFSERSQIEKLKMMKGFVNNIIKCRVLDIDQLSQTVSIELPFIGEGSSARLEKNDSTPRERSLRKVGHEFFGYGRRLLFEYDEETKGFRPVLLISRNNRKIVERLFHYYLHELASRDIKIKCTKRIAGAMSFVSVTKFIDRDIIKSVSKELSGERIIVKPFGKNGA